METIVYKLTRSDGLSYIGTAVNFRQRLWQHEHSKRFESGISLVEILGNFSTYEEALEFETKSIEEHDTYRNGLNKTPSGRGNHSSSKFTTKGFKFSEKSRKKMSESSRRRRAGESLLQWRKGLSEDELKILGRRVSRGKTGKPSHVTFEESRIRELMELFVTSEPMISQITKNGRPLSSLRAFCKANSERFSMTVTGMMNILSGKVLAWKQLYEQIIATRS